MSAAASFLHASVVAIGESGVLLCGPSGSGKSTLAFTLIAAAQDAGYFARLVGDDRIGISLHGNRLVARGHPSILGRIERRSQGIVAVPALAAAVLRLAIGLAGPGETVPRYPKPNEDHIFLAGAKLPFLRMRQNAAPEGLAHSLLADLRMRRVIF